MNEGSFTIKEKDYLLNLLESEVDIIEDASHDWLIDLINKVKQLQTSDETEAQS